MIDDIGPATDPVETDADQGALAPEALENDPRSFSGMNLDPEIQQALADMGYERAMDVQVAVFKQVMDGRDIMVQSRTGSGKTAAFGIPIAQKISAESSGAQVLILAPTRELALQVAEEMKRITRHKSIAVVPIYGGAPMKPQIDALTAGAQIVAGTPGRVLDHIRRGTLKTGGIRLLVLDECDEMLSMGFQEEIENILSFLPPREERQTMLFSATIPDAIERIGRRHMTDPTKISLSADGIGVREISHFYYMVSGLARTRDLLKVLKAERPESAIIFCNTREDTATVAKYLSRHGYDAEAISSDLAQKDRERVMKRSRDKTLQFLVATDIAARGIDISDLSHVINFTFPESPEVYVHRTGRTGRAGKTGVAISLVGPREIGAFYYLKLIYKIRPEERELPSAEELLTMQEGEQYERVVELVQEAPSQQYVSLARRLWQSVEGERVVGALLQRLLAAKGDLTAERPAPRPIEARPERPREEDAGPREDGASREGDEASSARPMRDSGRRERGRDRDGRRGDRDGRGRDRDGRRGDRDGRRGAGDDRPIRTIIAGPGAGESAPIDRPIRTIIAGPGAGESAPVDRPIRTILSGPGAGESAPVEATPAGETDESGEPRRKRRRRREIEGGGERERSGRPGERSGERGERSASRERGREARPEGERSASRERGREARPEGERSASRGREARPEGERRPSVPRPAPVKVADDGREFWEAWADEKSTRTGPAGEMTEPLPVDALQGEVRAAADGVGEVAEAGPREALDAAGRDERDDAERDEIGEDSGELEVGSSARLYVNIGKREDATADDIRALLCGDLGDDADRVGTIALRNTHCYVRVPEDLVDRVIDATRGKSFKERELVVERARR